VHVGRSWLAYPKGEAFPVNGASFDIRASHGRKGVVFCTFHGQKNVAVFRKLRLKAPGCGVSPLGQLVPSRDYLRIVVCNCRGVTAALGRSISQASPDRRGTAPVPSTTTSLHPPDSFPLRAVDVAYLTSCCCYTRTYYPTSHDHRLDRSPSRLLLGLVVGSEAADKMVADALIYHPSVAQYLKFVATTGTPSFMAQNPASYPTASPP
jgi:hypothetical protein